MVTAVVTGFFGFSASNAGNPIDSSDLYVIFGLNRGVILTQFYSDNAGGKPARKGALRRNTDHHERRPQF